MPSVQYPRTPSLGVSGTGRGASVLMPSTGPAGESVGSADSGPSALYVSLALLGIAALASAAASSLLQTGGSAVWPWLAGIASAGYGMAALVYSVVSFRKGVRAHPAPLLPAVSLAALLHLAGLLLALWRIPAESRTFDVTLAALVVLELSVLAVLGWRRHHALRQQRNNKSLKDPSAVAVVGTLFAASILVAALTTVGMAASTAGDLAVPHSGHTDTHLTPAAPANGEQLKDQQSHH